MIDTLNTDAVLTLQLSARGNFEERFPGSGVYIDQDILEKSYFRLLLPVSLEVFV
ncbi:MAG: hypothetical protein LBV68_05885 [Spirochaetaceae bacterium]|jgi:hypothetical protein|nr:hypothetical protein [Spirochaetaceae bacterium]